MMYKEGRTEVRPTTTINVKANALNPSFLLHPWHVVKMILKYLYATIKLVLPYLSCVVCVVNIRLVIEAICRYKTTKSLAERKNLEVSSDIAEGITEGMIIEEHWKQLHQ
jgi:hypothetical protein